LSDGNGEGASVEPEVLFEIDEDDNVYTIAHMVIYIMWMLKELEQYADTSDPYYGKLKSCVKQAIREYSQYRYRQA